MVYLERWKVSLIIAVCALALLYSAPNILGRQSVAWLQKHTPAFFPNQTVNLGLDLRGGSYLLLEVATDTVVDEAMQSLVDQTRTELRGAKIGYTDLGVSSGAVHFKLTDPTQTDHAQQVIRDMDSTLDVSNDSGNFTLRLGD